MNNIVKALMQYHGLDKKEAGRLYELRRKNPVNEKSFRKYSIERWRRNESKALCKR